MSAYSQGKDLPENNISAVDGRRYHYRHEHEHVEFDTYPQRPYSEPQYAPPQQYSQWLSPAPIARPNSSSQSLPLPSQPQNHPTAPRGVMMERTPSGNSIFSEAPSTSLPQSQNDDLHLLSDAEAANLVEKNIALIHHRNKNVRYLLSILSPPPSCSAHVQPIDDSTFRSLLHLFNTLFFASSLTGRVQWEWSDAPKYHSSLLATTALRQCASRPGFETLIIMSDPLLRSDKYERRLVLGTFIHELIHCYLFVNCGFEARKGGGHTDGFKRIARGIRKWVASSMGEKGDYLGLGCEKADLEAFRRKEDVCVDQHLHMDLGSEFERKSAWDGERRRSVVLPDSWLESRLPHYDQYDHRPESFLPLPHLPVFRREEFPTPLPPQYPVARLEIFAPKAEYRSHVPEYISYSR